MAHKTNRKPQPRTLDTTTRLRARRGAVAVAIGTVLMCTTWSCQNFDLTLKIGSVSVTPASPAGVTK